LRLRILKILDDNSQDPKNPQDHSLTKHFKSVKLRLKILDDNQDDVLNKEFEKYQNHKQDAENPED